MFLLQNIYLSLYHYIVEKFNTNFEIWTKNMTENVPVYSISYFLDTMYPAAAAGTLGNVPALTSGEQEIVSFILIFFCFLIFYLFFLT